MTIETMPNQGGFVCVVQQTNLASLHAYPAPPAATLAALPEPLEPIRCVAALRSFAGRSCNFEAMHLEGLEVGA